MLPNPKTGARRGLVATLALFAVMSLPIGSASAETSSGSTQAVRAGQETLHRGDRGPEVHRAQRQLAWLGYTIKDEERREEKFGYTMKKAVKEFQEKHFLDKTGTINTETQRTLARVAGRIGKLPKSCRSEKKVLCVDMDAKLLRFVRNGRVAMSTDIRLAMPGYSTPPGSYRVWWRDRYATSGINGPDQPRVPMPYALFFNGDIAVHYSSSFDANGYYPGGGSHGCVNVGSEDDSAWIFDRTPLDTLVHLY